jgi:peptide/nickel transport system permease protein
VMVVQPALTTRPGPAAPSAAESSRARAAGHAFSWSPSVVVGAVLVGGIVLLAVIGPMLSPYSAIAMAPAERLVPPGSPAHPLGTDQVGRDELTRLMDGARRTLLVGAAPVVLALIVGSVLGLLAGYYGGWTDQIVMRVIDVLFAFPAILLAIAIVSALGPGLGNTIVAITIVELPTVARLVRAPVLTLRQAEYVQAARVGGASDMRILVRHVGLNVISPLIVFASIEMGSIIIFGAGLSFLGLGTQPPEAEWGLMMAEARDVLAIAPAVATVPGLAILAVVLGTSLLGDGLREWLDPRTTGRRRNAD